MGFYKLNLVVVIFEACNASKRRFLYFNFVNKFSRLSIKLYTHNVYSKPLSINHNNSTDIICRQIKLRKINLIKNVETL